MIVKSMVITMRIPWAKSLKDKRMVVKSVLTRSRERFNVSSAEVSSHDDHNTAVLAFVCVAWDTASADSLLEHTLCYIENHFEVEIINIEYEVR